MLKTHICGIKTGHKMGYVYHADKILHYLLMIFRTPFFIVINGERIEGAAGDIVLHRPGSKVIHGPLKKNEQFVNDWIFFSDDIGITNTLPLPFDALIHSNNPSQFTDLISEIRNETVKNDEFSPKLIDGAIYKMLAALSRTGPKDSPVNDSMHLKFSEARLHILQRYGEKWRLEDMAKLTGYSPSRFSAIYSDLFGISPMNDLLEERIKIAKQLLNLHTYKIGDVAQMCGFSSTHYFSAFIRKHTGIKPSEY